MTTAYSDGSIPVGYAYDAALHCAACAKTRFQVSPLDTVILAKDSEGNEVTAAFAWDLACKESCIDCGLALSRRCLNCSDCDMWITGLEESVKAGNTSARKMVNKIRRINLYKEENNGSTY